MQNKQLNNENNRKNNIIRQNEDIDYGCPWICGHEFGKSTFER